MRQLPSKGFFPCFVRVRTQYTHSHVNCPGFQNTAGIFTPNRVSPWPIITAPEVTAWEDLAFFYEEVDDETGEFRYTAFAVVDEDDTALLRQVEPS